MQGQAQWLGRRSAAARRGRTSPPGHRPQLRHACNALQVCSDISRVHKSLVVITLVIVIVIVRLVVRWVDGLQLRGRVLLHSGIVRNQRVVYEVSCRYGRHACASVWRPLNIHRHEQVSILEQEPLLATCGPRRAAPGMSRCPRFRQRRLCRVQARRQSL